jgi:translation elongation factor EF-1alpha
VVAFAGPGESVKIIVKNIEYDRIRRGNIICGMQFWAMECEEFIAEVDILELPDEMLISVGFIFALHMHTILEDAEIVAILSRQLVNDEGRIVD